MVRNVRDIDPRRSPRSGRYSSKISSRRIRGDVLSVVQSRLDTSLPRVVAEQPVEALGLQRKKVGTSRGSLIFAKEMRSGAVLAPLFVFAVEAVRREAARGGPSEGSDSLRAYRPPTVGTETVRSRFSQKARSGMI